MDIDLYRTFLAITDTGSFTEAARQVGRTQSAVSQQIKRLETALGHPLFQRLAGSVELTEYGKSLIGYARTIVDTHLEAVSAFRRTEFEGIVVIGVADAYVNRILKQVVIEFNKLFPRATLNVVIDGSLDLSQRIADGSVDLAFVTEGNCPTRGPIVFRDRLVVIGPEKGELYKLDPLPVVVWDERNQDELPMITALDAMNRRWRRAFVCRSVNAQHAVITAGLCVGVLVEGSMIQGERAYLEPEGFPVLRELNIRLERARAKRSRVIERLEKHYLDYFAQETRRGVIIPSIDPAR